MYWVQLVKLNPKNKTPLSWYKKGLFHKMKQPFFYLKNEVLSKLFNQILKSFRTDNRWQS